MLRDFLEIRNKLIILLFILEKSRNKLPIFLFIFIKKNRNKLAILLFLSIRLLYNLSLSLGKEVN